MRGALLIALKNVKRYKLSALGRIIFLVIFSFVIISALMFSITITNSISDIVNARSSGNFIICRVEKSELENISKTQYINEAVIPETFTFVSGKALIEDLGTFTIDGHIYKAQNAGAFFPNAYLKEFEYISDDKLLLAGRLPQNNNELIINSGYLDKLQIHEYSMVIGKRIAAQGHFWDEPHIDEDSPTIVGVYSESFLGIAAYSSAKFRISAMCFTIDEASEYSGCILAFCDLENMDKASAILAEKYGDSKIHANSMSSFSLEELIRISSFIKKVMLLVSIVIGIVYIVAQIIIVSNYLNEKQEFVSAISAFGLRKATLVLIFAFEYLILLIIPFALSCGLSIIFTKTLAHYASIMSGMSFNMVFTPLPIIISLLIILAVSLISIFVSVYFIHSNKNE